MTSYQLCTGTVNQYSDPIGQGGFTFPVFGGACPVANGKAPIGVLSGTCSQNPYAGRAFTYIRESTPGAVPQDTIPLGTPASTPPLYTTDTFPDIGGQDTVQTLADGWCTGLNGPPAPEPLDSLCFADLAVRGISKTGKKSPGTTLSFSFDAATTYEFAGAMYTTETQYTLSGTNASVLTGVNTAGGVNTVADAVQKGAECGGGAACVNVVSSLTYVDPVFDSAQFVQTAQLNAYTVFTSITCQYHAASILDATGGLPYAGTGKYKQPAYNNHIATVDQTMTLVSADPVVANPTNDLLNAPLEWRTQLTVRYTGYVTDGEGWWGPWGGGIT